MDLISLLGKFYLKMAGINVGIPGLFVYMTKKILLCLLFFSLNNLFGPLSGLSQRIEGLEGILRAELISTLDAILEQHLLF